MLARALRVGVVRKGARGGGRVGEAGVGAGTCIMTPVPSAGIGSGAASIRLTHFDASAPPAPARPRPPPPAPPAHAPEQSRVSQARPASARPRSGRASALA